MHYPQVYWTPSRTITVCWSRSRSVWRTIWSKRGYFSLGSTSSLTMSCLKSYHRREILRQSSPTFENALMPFPGTCLHIICMYIISPFNIQSFLFPSLEFGTTPSPEPGAPPIITNDILSMVSPEKEIVPLQKVRYKSHEQREHLPAHR